MATFTITITQDDVFNAYIGVMEFQKERKYPCRRYWIDSAVRLPEDEAIFRGCIDEVLKNQFVLARAVSKMINTSGGINSEDASYLEEIVELATREFRKVPSVVERLQKEIEESRIVEKQKREEHDQRINAWRNNGTETGKAYHYLLDGVITHIRKGRSISINKHSSIYDDDRMIENITERKEYCLSAKTLNKSVKDDIEKLADYAIEMRRHNEALENLIAKLYSEEDIHKVLERDAMYHSIIPTLPK
jgi:hypothetical protein